MIIPFGFLKKKESEYPTSLVGLWEFLDSGDIGKATVGTDLSITGTTPTHAATTTDGSSTTLNGVITTIGNTGNHLTATHGIGANGGGSNTNVYSFVFDVLTQDSTAWKALIQNSLANSADATYFVKSGNTVGRGTIQYTTNTLTVNKWTRIVFSVELDPTTSVLTTTFDGTTFTHDPTVNTDNTIFSLDTSQVLLFADESNENQPLQIGVVAIFDIALNASQITALGNAGDPINIE